MLKKILLGAGAIVALLVLLVAVLISNKPDSFEVHRTLSIASAPEPIYNLIVDFKQWARWSPFDKLDPQVKRTFSGSETGQGSKYAWSGNEKVGVGEMEIVEAKAPEKVTIKLDFIKPFEAHNVAEFTLAPSGENTDVTWSMRGPSNAIMKVMNLFVSCDDMVGKDFEQGLKNIKAIVEKK